MGTKLALLLDLSGASHSAQHARRGCLTPTERWEGFAQVGSRQGECGCFNRVLGKDDGQRVRPPTFLGLGDTSKCLFKDFSVGSTFLPNCWLQECLRHMSGHSQAGSSRRHSFRSCNKFVSSTSCVPLLGTGEIE